MINFKVTKYLLQWYFVELKTLGFEKKKRTKKNNEYDNLWMFSEPCNEAPCPQVLVQFKSAVHYVWVSEPRHQQKLDT